MGAQVDKNLTVDLKIEREGMKFFDVESAPFRVYGIKKIGDRYRRMPEEVAKSVSVGVYELHANTSGGRVRFVTDSKKIAIFARLGSTDASSHMPQTEKAGFDLYVDDEYAATFVPPFTMPNNEYESSKQIFIEGEHTVTINFPTYSDVLSLHVGIEEGATLRSAPDYKYEIPVVYYGSSITQGAFSSRPGRTYQAILSRELDCNFVNLGFSASAMGEAEMREYMAGLEMSAFVCDYDFNALTPEALQQTHEPIYRAVRAMHPKIPIIFISRPTVRVNDRRKKRVGIIKATYDKAVSEGDKNVYFIDGKSFFPFDSDEFTADNCHPTDLGFYFMAKGIYPMLKEGLLKGTDDENS